MEAVVICMAHNDEKWSLTGQIEDKGDKRKQRITQFMSFSKWTVK